MKQYTSWGSPVEVELTNGKEFHNVILCPSPDHDGKHILEHNNGDCITINTDLIRRITSHYFKRETLIK